MKKGFTLLEMLVVIGIIAVLIGAVIGGYNAAIDKAQTAKAQELVYEVATALEQVYQKDDSWPRPIRLEGSTGNGQITPEVGGVLAKRGALSLTYRADEMDGTTIYRLSGQNRFGVVTPWADAVIKRHAKGEGVTLTTKVPSGGTIETHRLHFAIDEDGNGKVNVTGEGITANVRATVCVWCAGKDGKFGTKDDVKSWTKGQEIQ